MKNIVGTWHEYVLPLVGWGLVLYALSGAGGCSEPVFIPCGSVERPLSLHPECPCADYAVTVPDAGWGTATCRTDQRGEVRFPGGAAIAQGRGALQDITAISGSNGILFCSCSATIDKLQ